MSWMRICLASFAVLCLGAGLAGAEEIGRVKTVSGEAYLVRGDARLAASLGDAVEQGDGIETGADGTIGVTFNDNTVFSAGPNTRLTLEQYSYEPATLEGAMLADLLQGTLVVTSGDIPRGSPDAMRVRTPSAVLGVRGTKFLVRVGAGGGM